MFKQLNTIQKLTEKAKSSGFGKPLEIPFSSTKRRLDFSDCGSDSAESIGPVYSAGMSDFKVNQFTFMKEEAGDQEGDGTPVVFW